MHSQQRSTRTATGGSDVLRPYVWRTVLAGLLLMLVGVWVFAILWEAMR